MEETAQRKIVTHTSTSKRSMECKISKLSTGSRSIEFIHNNRGDKEKQMCEVTKLSALFGIVAGP